jgi:hypothetical protein
MKRKRSSSAIIATVAVVPVRGRPTDEDRPLDGLLGGLGVVAVPLLDLQPLHEILHDLVTGGHVDFGFQRNARETVEGTG